MTKIQVSSDEAMCGEDMVQDYVDLLNGIVFDCLDHFAYTEGTRNEVAVDLTVASYMLGLDPEDTMRTLIKENVINPDNDDEDPMQRVRTIMDYADRFDWDWMLNPQYYVDRGVENRGLLPRVWFAL